MINSLSILRRTIVSFLARIGDSVIFLGKLIASLPSLLFRPKLLINQIYSVGVLSLLIIVVSGFFVGMVLALQGYNSLVKFGAEKSLGVMVALSLVRELGPVVTALLFAGRAGSALTAEISLMKSTEQLSGLEMMAVDPMKRIMVARFFACLISVPLLVAIFNMVAVFGGHAIGVSVLSIDSGSFWSQMQAGVSWSGDVVNGLIKSIIFGGFIGWVSVYEGYTSVPTAAGMSRATTRSVVQNSLLILALDFILTAIMF